MSQPIPIQKSQGLRGDPVDTFMDRVSLQSRASATQTVINDGNTTSTFLTSTLTAKVFARGMAGQIDNIQVLLQNTAATSGTVLFGFRPFLDADDEFYVAFTVPTDPGGTWYTVNVRKSWNFDKLVVVVWFLSTASIGIGYDAKPPWDRYDFDTTVTNSWVSQSARLYIRTTISGQVTEAVPITGLVTVKNIEAPLIGGAVVIRPTSESGRVIFVDDFQQYPLQWGDISGSGSTATQRYGFAAGLNKTAGMLLTANANGNFAEASRSFGYRQKKIGVELSFAISNVGKNPYEARFNLYYVSPAAMAFNGGCRIDGYFTRPTQQFFQLYDFLAPVVLTETSVNFYTPPFSTNSYPSWHKIKFILDMNQNDNRMVNGILDGVELVMPPTAAALVGSAASTQIYALVDVTFIVRTAPLPGPNNLQMLVADAVLTEED